MTYTPSSTRPGLHKGSGLVDKRPKEKVGPESKLSMSRDPTIGV